MKKVLAVTLNLQSSRHWCWPMASAQPSSPASGDERRPNFTRAFCAGTRSALPSASRRERRVSKAPGNPPSPPGDQPAPRSPGPAWDRAHPPPAAGCAASAPRAATQQDTALQSRRKSLRMAREEEDGALEQGTDEWMDTRSHGRAAAAAPL